jgi:hypothetical protein
VRVIESFDDGYREWVCQRSFMEKENRLYYGRRKEQVNMSSSKGRKTDLTHGRVHEYDFFLAQDEEETAEVLPETETLKRKKVRDRNKSMAFFLSK